MITQNNIIPNGEVNKKYRFSKYQTKCLNESYKYFLNHTQKFSIETKTISCYEITSF